MACNSCRARKEAIEKAAAIKAEEEKTKKAAATAKAEELRARTRNRPRRK